MKIIGVGPGDPELLTICASKALGASDIIYLPFSQDEGRGTVEAAAAKYAPEAELRPYRIFMRNNEALNKEYDALAAEIREYISYGKNVSYAVPGDGTFYSTAWALTTHLNKLGITYEFIPGVPSFVACANAAAFALAYNKDNMFLGLLPSDKDKIAEIINTHDTTVFMKLSKNLSALLEVIYTIKPSEGILVQKVSMDEERIVDLTSAATLDPELAWLSVAIIRK